MNFEWRLLRASDFGFKNGRFITYTLRLLLFIMMASSSSLTSADDAPVWQKAGRGIYEPGITAVAVHPEDNAVLYAATSRAIYKSVNGGMDFGSIFQPRGEPPGINFLYIPPAAPRALYAAADTGLYQSLDAGTHWEQVYDSSDENAKVCRSVIEQSGIFYLGTGKGLFTKLAGEKNWRRVEGELGQAPIGHMKEHGGSVYIATDRALFRRDMEGGGYQQVFSSGAGPSREENGEWDEGIAAAEGLIRLIETFGSYIFIATSTGIYASADEGRQWQRLASDHVPLEDLTALLVMEGSHGQGGGQDRLENLGLLAGSKKGAFLFKDGGWRPIYGGMETNRISRLAKDARNTVYAATDRGMFHLALNGAPSSFSNTQEHRDTPAQIKQWEDLDAEFGGEPGINEVHRLAVDYAEVSPEKITEWRRLAQRRAWLPDLDIGVDSASDWSRSSSIWGSYTSGGQHYAGPDDKTRGGDLGWDVALSWNLGDLIYSSEQTTIDSRSKLMVELREDILDQVTRLYFERRRVQAELAAAQALEPWIKIDKEMRVAELTALLDAFTGGQFSRRIHKD